jgi:hypothetical protein
VLSQNPRTLELVRRPELITTRARLIQGETGTRAEPPRPCSAPEISADGRSSSELHEPPGRPVESELFGYAGAFTGAAITKRHLRGSGRRDDLS